MSTVARAAAYLRSHQRPDGGWASPGDIGPAATAQTAVCLDHAGELSADDARAIARWLAGHALPGGGFVSFPSAPEGDVGGTAVAAAFLARHGGPPDVIRRAEVFVARGGGHRRIIDDFARGDTSAVLLAMAGALDPDQLPDRSLAALTLPPLERWFTRHFHGGILMTMYAARLLVLALRGKRGLLAAAERRRGVYWLSEFQNRFDGARSGSWNAWAPITAFHLAALRAAGVSREDRRIRLAATWLHDEAVRDGEGLHWDAFETPLWATLFSTHALLEAGEAAGSPVLAAAEGYLLASQCREPQSRHNHVRGHGPRVGGFAFRRDNPVLPDCDDAGAALGALAALRTVRPSPRLDGAITACTRWLLGMQNTDGGFASYTCGLPGKPAGPLFVEPVDVDPHDLRALVRLVRRPPRELGDPSTEDVTGRVLHGLGLAGFRAGEPAVDRAVAFLRAQQLPDGSWWGRWLTNYLAGTAYAVRGALAVGAAGAWIDRGLDFLIVHQQPDGAWGESVDSYRDPARKAQGPSCPAVTGRVLCALLDGGRDDSAAVRRGLAWLRAHQLADGSWDGSRHLAVIYPPDRYYTHAAAGTYYPLWALALAESRTRHRTELRS